MYIIIARTFILILLFLTLISFNENTMTKVENHRLLYVGTYTENNNQGVEVYSIDDSGKLTFKSIQRNINNPSYITISQNKKYLYTANELMNYTDKNGGYVSSYNINENSGDLTFINKLYSEGGAPCYATTSQNGKFVLISNYMQGTVASFSTNNGQLEKAISVIKHSGSGPNTKRQEASHLHSINLDSKNNKAYAADLGADKIYIYDFDTQTGTLTLQKNSISLSPGAGPRHFEFSKNGLFIYVLNELNNTIEIFKINSKNKQSEHVQTISTLPDDFKGSNYSADIHLSPLGEYLYSTNRGHNSIAIFKTTEANGKLTLLGTESVGGDWPRNFVIDPNGKFLLIANQKSNNIVSFSIKKDGLLKQIQDTKTNASPVCLKVF